MPSKYKVEYSQSRTSKCQGCQLTIEKGEIRAGTLSADGTRMKNYHHARCMSKGALLTDFVEIETLSPKDQDQVRMWILEDNMASQTRKRAESTVQTTPKQKGKSNKKQKSSHFYHTPPNPFYTPPPTAPNPSSSSSPFSSPNAQNKTPPQKATPPASADDIYKKEMNDLVNEATAIYKTTNDLTIPLETRYQTCVKAFRLYSEAHDFAVDADFKVGVRRNMGMVAYKASALSLEKVNLNKAIFHMQACVHNLSSAVEEGAQIATRSRDWQKTIEDKVIAAIDLISFHTDTTTTPDRVSALLQLSSQMTSYPLLQAELNYKIASVIFNEAVSMQDNKEWGKSKGKMGSMIMYLSEAQRLCDAAISKRDTKVDAEILKTFIEDLDNRKRIHLCIAESRGLTTVADEDFAKQVFGEECININHIWHIVDNYQQAAILTRELDNEGEAMALSRIGKIYDKIFKIKEKAHSYFRRSLDLAFSLQPRDLSPLDWFREAQGFLTKYQNEKLLEEQRKQEELKRPYLLNLKEKLDLIKAANTSSVELLNYIYKNHPPANRVLLADESTERKLVQAIVHYYAEEHSTSNDINQEQKVLYGEIAKMLNGRHENVKNV